MVELPSGQCLFSVIGGNRFPLQFGREVLCSSTLLNCPERIEWKQCILGKEVEAVAAKEYRTAFSALDPFSKSK